MQGYDFSRVPAPIRDAGEQDRLSEENWRREMGLVFDEEDNTAGERRQSGAGEEQDAEDEGCSLRPC